MASTSKAVFTAQTNESEAAEDLLVTTPKSSGTIKKKKAPHGTGSTIARAKGELERQWMESLNQKNLNDRVRNEKLEILAELRKENTKLKRKHYALKEREMEWKREREEAKVRDKKLYYDRIVALEEKRLKLDEKKYSGKENKRMFSDSE